MSVRQMPWFVDASPANASPLPEISWSFKVGLAAT